MMCKTLLLAAIVVVAVTAKPSLVKYSDEPAFCKTLDCPTFNKTGEGKGYEIRAYSPAKWVSTTILNLNYDEAVEQGFEYLFKYISGDNVPGIKVDMTAPVTTRVIPAPGPACENNFTVSFFVPFIHQDNPPQPSNPQVSITSLPAFEAYVRVFPGRAKQDDWIKNAELLKESLQNTTAEYDKTFYYTAGYDSPFTIFERHNEIWFFKSSS